MTAREAHFGPWTAGMVNTPKRIPVKALADAVNVDVDVIGHVSRRAGFGRQIEGDGTHSLFEHGGKVYYVIGDTLSGRSGEQSHTIGKVSGARLAWTVVNGEAVCSSTLDGVLRVTAAGLEAYPFIEAEHDEPYIPTRLPGGNHIAYWRGRLLSASGAVLWFSEPMNFGVCDGLRGFIQFERPIEWIAAMDEGIYLSVADTVRWLEGTTPEQMQVRIVGGVSAKGAALVVGGAALPEGLNTSLTAVWFSDKGFALGLPGGQVVVPGKDVLQDLPLPAGKIAREGNRVFFIADKEEYQP